MIKDNLSTNTELNSSYPFTIPKRRTTPTKTIFALSIRSQSDKVLINNRITSTFPTIYNSITYSTYFEWAIPTRIVKFLKKSWKRQFWYYTISCNICNQNSIDKSMQQLHLIVILMKTCPSKESREYTHFDEPFSQLIVLNE